jgi:hypothetical protein
MKKKQALALMLAVAMASATSMTAMAAEVHSGDHGTKDVAVVSGGENHENTEEVDTMTDNEQEGNTQFYIVVDKGASSGTEIEIPVSQDYTGDGDICHYDVQWAITRKSNLSVTVPLYVCMYGYGGDGKVVTPEEDAYYMLNSSKYKDYKEVKEITPCYKIKDIKTERDEYLKTEPKEENIEAYLEEYAKKNPGVDQTEEKIAELTAEYKKAYAADLQENFDNSTFVDVDGNPVKITDTELSGEYGFFTKNNQNYLVRLSDCDIHTNDTECGNNSTYFYRDSSVEEASYVTDSSTDPVKKTTISKGDKLYAYASADDIKDGADLPVNVPTIKANINTWKIQPTSAANSLKAGEIVMTIKNVDLYDVEQAKDNGDENSLDIRDLKWILSADNDNKLELPVYAAIAGGNVNEEGCVPVVKVTYKVSPAMDIIKNTEYKSEEELKNQTNAD